MAGNINKVILIGNLGGHPEIHSRSAGESIVTFDLATSESWRDRISGDRRERTEWHHVAIFSKRLGDVASMYLRKGSKVYIEGQLRTRQWEDPQGQQRSAVEVVLRDHCGELVMLGSPRGGEHPEGDGAAPEAVADMPADIPF